MAGPFFSESRPCRSPRPFVIGPLLHVLLFRYLLEVLLLKASSHVTRSPAESNITTIPLTNLMPQQLNFDSFDMTGALFNPPSRYIPLSTLPPLCDMYHKPDGECSASMIAVNVTYDDCSDAWTICHCSTANVSLDDAVERLGKIPVGLRKYVATTLILPGDETHAYSLTNGDLHMFGDCRAETWIHEATHSYDYAFGSPISGGQAWLDAIASDTCATDQYGTTNAAEELAQMSVLKIFSLIYGTLPSGWDASCMSNQLAFLDTLPLYNKTTLFSDTCAAPTSTSGSPDNVGNEIFAVRPLKAIGPPMNPDDPLRVDSNANPTPSLSRANSTVASPTPSPTTPASVAQDPEKAGSGPKEINHKENGTPSQFITSAWKRQALLCLPLVLFIVT